MKKNIIKKLTNENKELQKEIVRLKKLLSDNIKAARKQCVFSFFEPVGIKESDLSSTPEEKDEEE